MKIYNAQSCLILSTPRTVAHPGPSVHGILQARILEWVAMPSSRGYFQLRDQNCISYISCIAGGFFTPLVAFYLPSAEKILDALHYFFF